MIPFGRCAICSDLEMKQTQSIYQPAWRGHSMATIDALIPCGAPLIRQS